MNNLLEKEIVEILNAIQRTEAPKLDIIDVHPSFTETSDYKFDLVDSKNGSPIRPFKEGTAHYINGHENDTFSLLILCYDDYLHQFTYDDGKGHKHVNRLKDGIKMADFLVYDKTDSKKYFLVHELSVECSNKKIRTAKKQLSDTLNQLYKSANIASFIDSFEKKLCYLSAKDTRIIVPTERMADGFTQIYQVLPEPLQFNFGQIGTHQFQAYETSYIELTIYTSGRKI